MTLHTRWAKAKVILDVAASLSLILAAVWVIVASSQGWLSSPRSLSVVNAAAESSPAARPTQPPPAHPLEGSALLGDRNAKLALIEYADFECEFCAQFRREVWPDLKTKYIDTGVMLASFRHLPLAGHQHARPAALSALCADDQGRFWEMHDGLFGVHNRLTATTGNELAIRLGLNRGRFDECVEASRARLDADIALAGRFSISATPSFVVGRIQHDRTVKVSRVLVGALPREQFTELIDDLLTQ